jgi:hypothetical protein
LEYGEQQQRFAFDQALDETGSAKRVFFQFSVEKQQGICVAFPLLTINANKPIVQNKLFCSQDAMINGNCFRSGFG